VGRVEQRMKMVNFAVISLFFPVIKRGQKYWTSRNGFCFRELGGFIRRSQE